MEMEVCTGPLDSANISTTSASAKLESQRVLTKPRLCLSSKSSSPILASIICDNILTTTD
jgi:hypothetical protein